MSAGTGYCPLPYQHKAHAACPVDPTDTQRKLLIAGIGTGKSEWNVAEALVLTLLNPGGWGAVIAPTYDQVVHVLLPRWTRMVEAMSTAGYPLVRRWNKTLLRADLHCGGHVFFRSASKVDNLLGLELAWASLDEVETLPHPMRVWDTIAGRIRQKAHVRQIYGTSTPRGLQGCVEQFHRAREVAKGYDEPERSETLRRWFWLRATSFDNPHLPRSYLESLRAGYSKRRWQQEVLAEILKPQSAVFDELDPERHVRPWVYDGGMDYLLGYDAGHQWPAVLWIQRTPWNGFVVFDELVEDGIPRGHLHNEIVRRCRKLGRPPAIAAGDRAVKSEIAWLREEFPQTYVTSMRSREEQNVGEGIELIRSLLDPIDGPPRLYVAERLTRRAPRRGIWPSLRNYRYRMRADGTLSGDVWKDNVTDHQVDALRYALTAALKRDAGIRSVGRNYG